MWLAGFPGGVRPCAAGGKDGGAEAQKGELKEKEKLLSNPLKPCGTWGGLTDFAEEARNQACLAAGRGLVEGRSVKEAIASAELPCLMSSCEGEGRRWFSRQEE